MNCTSCNSEAVTVELKTGSDGTPAGVQGRCFECGATWRVEPFKPANKLEQTVSTQDVVTAQLPTQKKPENKPAHITKKLTEKSLIAQAKKQIKEMDREITRLEKLKRQRDQLSKLIDAANANGPKVVAIRRTVNQ